MAQQFTANNFVQNPNHFVYIHNPNLLYHNNLLLNSHAVPFQNPNFPAHNSGVQAQNHSTHPIGFQNPNFQPHNGVGQAQNPSSHPVPFQNSNFQAQSNGFQAQNTNNHYLSFPHPQLPRATVNENIQRIDNEVVKARCNILASGENVSAWKVAQAVFLALKVDSWESLGFQMQQIPALHNLMIAEGKINAFIHCFVGVRRITTVYDLEMAICKNEGVEQFEELELGPLLRHPLVVHYFSVRSDAKEVFRITCEEIISCLHEFMDSHEGKEVKIDELLDFIAEKYSLTGREELNVRIQNLGSHISHIRKALQSENTTLKKYVDGLKEKFGIRIQKHPLLSSQKKQLDDRFKDISARIRPFSFGNVEFCGKHTRFSSSSSDDVDSNDTEPGDYQHGDEVQSHMKPHNPKTSERVSSCPYPSATEEMTRLGLKPEVDESVVYTSENARLNKIKEVPKRKRKSYCTNGSDSLPWKMPRRDQDEANPFSNRLRKESLNEELSESAFFSESTRMFIATWKDPCRHCSVDEVLDRMLNFYDMKKNKKKKLRALFSSYPFSGLLDFAVKSIKSGTWDSMYDALQTIGHDETTYNDSENPNNSLSIDVEVGEEGGLVSINNTSRCECGVAADDIIKKVTSYFKRGVGDFLIMQTTLEQKFMFLSKLCSCESWLVEQFHVKEFECLGYGNFMAFMERFFHLLPDELKKCFINEKPEKHSYEACMLQLELDVLLTQASTNLWQKEKINKQMIYKLLRRQFPTFCFESVQSDVLFDIQDTIRESEVKVNHKCILFSVTLFEEAGIADSMAQNNQILLDSAGFERGNNYTMGSVSSVTPKEAIEMLLNSPLLTDLDSWLHWDLIYAPSLGPLMLWLLNEVNTKELLCLVTNRGKIVRLDHSATVDSFLEALIKGSSFETAVKLLSLLAIYGGERNVPMSLLKCHAQKAFQLLIGNSEGKELCDQPDYLVHGDRSSGEHVNEKNMCRNITLKLHNDRKVNKGAIVASRFILDCLSYLPTEFCSFAAKVLVAGLRAFVKDAPSVILSECKQVKQRVLLHDLGFSLGIIEWINDYHTFCSSKLTNSIASSEPSFPKDVNCACISELEFVDNMSACPPSGDGMAVPNKAGLTVICEEVSPMEKFAKISADASPSPSHVPTDYLKDPNQIIESIRQEEFGLDPNLSATESDVLKKQHARLGRALHCLSHELYSQDSHFLLELIQNADDNIYPETAEPTLVFILQEKGVVILNNEIGFSAENIKALCDVGNSTKRGTSTGYIGKKGIGFKSVFRVTDAPEIHSNGFHIKFDTTEGQIGFVLPTEVPPCDVNFFTRLVSIDTDQVDCNSWRTCIVLPFKKKLSTGFNTGNILSMFTDLHPSLLLFLHRLQCIKFRDLLNDSLIIMKKEVLTDGIVKVSLGKQKMFWYVVSQKLKADTIRPDVRSTEISLAFTLEETGDGDYIPQLNQQPVFAFLPLRNYGLKFILQGDFVLPSSREEVDGDSPWNQWLLSEFPGLFVSAQRSFCDLPCFQRTPGRAVTAFLNFVPLLGEVHGFFSSLPRMIISKLRMSNCLLLEGDMTEWVPPCKVLRNWNEQACDLLPEGLLREHLGMGFLKRDIVLPDSLAKALGIEEYGPKILLHVMSSLSHLESGLKLMGLSWIAAWTNAIYLMSLNSGNESELITNLKKIPFIPLSDGKYGSVDKAAIWMHSGITGIDNEYKLKAFPELHAKLQTVNPELFSAAATAEKSCPDTPSIVENVSRMLLKIGVQRLSPHDIVKVHILPAISDERNVSGCKDLMIEYLSFIMFHLQSGCRNCLLERELIVKHMQSKALILTNYGYKRLNEVPIHFNKDFGNPVDMDKLTKGRDIRWHEVDSAYLTHPITGSLRDGMLKWRNFFQELGVTDFVQIVQVEKYVRDISPDILKDLMGDIDLISLGSIAQDWESPELVHLLSNLSSRGEPEKCKYLLEILDKLWDDYFDDRVSGNCKVTSSAEDIPFKSSLLRILQNVKWMVSVMDDDFHYPRDLFNDCEALRSMLGATAPYVVPKVKSQKLLSALGMKSQVRLDDILVVLNIWRRAETPMKASISQMSKFYTFIWNEMATSKQKITEEVFSGPFIFVPCESATSSEDVVPGSLLGPKEVYWYDKTGSLDKMNLMQAKYSSDSRLSISKMLCTVYPTLHDFFVNECGVGEIPPYSGYLHILLQLSTITLPSQAARAVFDVFSQWAEGLTSGSLGYDDIEYLKESFQRKECAVLPTLHDKWVSLHPSFGLICWSVDDNLRNEFINLNSIHFVSFGHLKDEEKEMIQTKVAHLFRRLGIPALSEVISREAIYYGPADSSFKASLINWALPYAQRYICHLHQDVYVQLRKSECKNLRSLQIVVVEKLFYRNIIKRCEIASKKRFECSCLLEGNILYATRESDSHSIYMELSRLFFAEAPQLQFANFLHMITTMAEAGSTEDQTEFFILNSQKVPKLPAEESVWYLWSPFPIPGTEKSPIMDSVSKFLDESSIFKYKKPSMNSNWPPVNWRTAPGFTFAHANRLAMQVSGKLQIKEADDETLGDEQADHFSGAEINVNSTPEHRPVTAPLAGCLGDAESLGWQANHNDNSVISGMDMVLESVDLVTESDGPKFGSFNSNLRNQQSSGTYSTQAQLTGRLGEFVAFKYFVGKVGEASVHWVNEANETGLPYDLVIGSKEMSQEYVEVKSTKSAKKDWFEISVREWQFAVEKGESFSIAHVLLFDSGTAKVTVYKNPLKLCQLSKLRLAVVMPKLLEQSNMA